MAGAFEKLQARLDELGVPANDPARKSTALDFVEPDQVIAGAIGRLKAQKESAVPQQAKVQEESISFKKLLLPKNKLELLEEQRKLK